MLEIFALVWLSKNIKSLAYERRESKNKWVILSIVAWFGGEILGAVIGFSMVSGESMGLPLLFAYVGAILGWLTIRTLLASKSPQSQQVAHEEVIDNDFFK